MVIKKRAELRKLYRKNFEKLGSYFVFLYLCNRN